MPAFILKRLFIAIPVLAVVISATFLLIRMAPGSPFQTERSLDHAVEARLLERFRLDGTPAQQLTRYWKNILLNGDLGDSTQFRNRTVAEILRQTVPNSMLIGSISLILALTGGIVIGAFAAVHHNRTEDRIAMLGALAGISLPSFIIAPFLVLLLSLFLPLFPPAGWGAPAHLVLPVICLALPYAAYCSRLMRTSMLEVLSQDFVRTARAKGLSERIVIYKHALKIAILPLISFAGPLTAHILTGSVVIEEIFKIPGLGPFFVNSVLNRDYFLVCGAVIVYSTLLILMNLIVDVLYTFLDKRVRLT